MLQCAPRENSMIAELCSSLIAEFKEHATATRDSAFQASHHFKRPKYLQKSGKLNLNLSHTEATCMLPGSPSCNYLLCDDSDVFFLLHHNPKTSSSALYSWRAHHLQTLAPPMWASRLHRSLIQQATAHCLMAQPLLETQGFLSASRIHWRTTNTKKKQRSALLSIARCGQFSMDLSPRLSGLFGCYTTTRPAPSPMQLYALSISQSEKLESTNQWYGFPQNL